MSRSGADRQVHPGAGTQAPPGPEGREAPGPAGAARPARTRTRPTRRGVLVGALGLLLYAAGANTSAGWVVALAAALLGSLPWALVTARWAARGLTLRRELPATVVAGVPVEATLVLSAPVGAVAVVHDLLTGAAGAATGLRGGATLTTTATLRRGYVRGGPIEVVLTDPLGLVEVRLAGTVPGQTLVLPPVPRAGAPGRGPGWLPAAGEASRHGAGPEVVGVREYRSGDAVRSVHWRSTARRGRLMVRDLADDSRPRVRIEVAGGAWPRRTLDRAAEVAAALADGAVRAGLPAELAADGTALPWSAAARRTLALLPPHGGAPPRSLAPAPPHQAAVVVRLDPAPGGLAAAVTSAGRTRPLGVLPAGADVPEVERWLATDPGGEREVVA